MDEITIKEILEYDNCVIKREEFIDLLENENVKDCKKLTNNWYDIILNNDDLISIGVAFHYTMDDVWSIFDVHKFEMHGYMNKDNGTYKLWKFTKYGKGVWIYEYKNDRYDLLVTNLSDCKELLKFNNMDINEIYNECRKITGGWYF